MYKRVLRPILFLFSPERIHGFAMWGLRVMAAIPGGKWLMRRMFGYNSSALERDVFGITFKNPIGLAAGFDKNGDGYNLLSTLGFGFVEVGTVTPQPQPGNPKPRLFRLKKDGALINRMGFNNEGVDNLVENMRHRKSGEVVGVNLGKNTITPNDEAPADYLRMFRKLYEYGDYFVINVSCPNIKDIQALQTHDNLMAILEGLFEFRRGQNEYRPLLLKISPDLKQAEIDVVIDILMTTPLDGIVAINTTTSREELITPSAEVERCGDGGLSGAPLTQRAIEMVRYIHQKSDGQYPIIGVGGVMSPSDAERMLEAGASLVQVYTGFIYEGPAFVKRICKHLESKFSDTPQSNT